MAFSTRFIPRAAPMLHGHRRHECRRRNSISASPNVNLPPWPRNAAPSPHEILGVKPGEVYSKETFHRLVKLYHPDMRDESVERVVSHAVRLERYRLIIAAHGILSDPQKRQLYERHDLGWTPSHNESPSRGSRSKKSRPRTEPPSPMRQKPIYTSNAAFAVFLLALAMMSAVLQIKRLRSSRDRQRKLQAVLQDAIGEELEAWASILAGQSRDDRILAFLARRHGVPQQLERWASTQGRYDRGSGAQTELSLSRPGSEQG